MKKFRNVPALVTLFAGFVVAVFMIIEKFTLINFLWILVSVMLAFYIAGIVLRRLLNKTFKEPEEEENGEESSENPEEQQTEENPEDNKLQDDK